MQPDNTLDHKGRSTVLTTPFDSVTCPCGNRPSLVVSGRVIPMAISVAKPGGDAYDR